MGVARSLARCLLIWIIAALPREEGQNILQARSTPWAIQTDTVVCTAGRMMAVEVLMLDSHGLFKKISLAENQWCCFLQNGRAHNSGFYYRHAKKKSMGREDGMVKSESLTFISLCY